MKYPYFRGLEADRYSFYRVPKALIKIDLFEKMSGDAKLLYIKGSKTAKGHTASCSVVLGCFATYWVAKGNSCYLMGSSQNATNAL